MKEYLFTYDMVNLITIGEPKKVSRRNILEMFKVEMIIAFLLFCFLIKEPWNTLVLRKLPIVR